MLDVLRVLTTVGDIGEKAWNERYDWLARRGDEYYILVVCNAEKKVVGTGAVVVERKLYVLRSSPPPPANGLGKPVANGAMPLANNSIHNLGLVGHIEDIAVAKDQQGKKLGLRIIQALGFIAEKVGCYKTILDCSETNEGFYVKCGYKRTGLEMALYNTDKK
ncbi:MAG: hypothetical protein LQ348_001595 [Seirophora lacunosa]|nr:MAG: hypothetical protein LQ348_001595 [Seirophora lacunosa]